ncbi:family 16 glycoside hydrolase [Candidatus Poribacteria bacterium]
MERTVRLIAVLVIMAAIQLPVNAETLFFDDFEDDLDNWKILGGNVTIVEDDTTPDNHVMDFNGAGQNIVAKDDSFRDLTGCIIEVKGRAVEQLQWTEVVILFRVQGDNVNYYQAYTNVHSFDTNTVLNNGAFVDFNTVNNIPIVVGEWFTKRVRIEGKNIQVFIDDQLYIDEERDNLDKGTFGSRSATVHVQYDDWHVYDLDGPSEQPGAVNKDGKLAVAWGAIKSH